MKKFTLEDVEMFCRVNGYYLGEYWFPHRDKNKKKDE